MEREPNILFIGVDALRARNLSCYGYPKKTSPNIDRLSKEGVLFEDAYCCINTTDPSFTTIFSGKYPVSHGLLMHGAMIQKEDTLRLSRVRFLPEILKSVGYTTLAVDWLGRWHRRGYDYYGIGNEHCHEGKKEDNKKGKDRRRDDNFASLHKYIKTYLTPVRYFVKRMLPKLPLPLCSLLVNINGILRPPSKELDISQRADSVSNMAIDLIKKNKNKKFFLFLHYWDTHSPYTTPKKHFYHLVKGFASRYDESIAFVDHEIGRVINSLEEHRILDKTIVILTSDHGESLMEHGIYFDHHGLYDEVIHVPLIIRYPRQIPEGKRVKGFVQHVDIVPTLLHILDIKNNFDFDGKSTIPLIYDKTQLRSAVYVEEAHTQRKRAIRTDRFKYIYALSEREAVCRYCGYVHGGLEELYDLSKDPGETVNLIDDCPDIAKKLKKELSEWVSFMEDKREKEYIRKKIKKLKASGRLK